MRSGRRGFDREVAIDSCQSQIGSRTIARMMRVARRDGRFLLGRCNARKKDTPRSTRLRSSVLIFEISYCSSAAAARRGLERRVSGVTIVGSIS